MIQFKVTLGFQQAHRLVFQQFFPQLFPFQFQLVLQAQSIVLICYLIDW